MDNYLYWLMILTVQGMNGSTFGFMFGNYISDPITCIMISYFGLVLIYFGGGAFTNYNDEETIIQDFFQTISPFRYAGELMMRTMLDGYDKKEAILTTLGFNCGEDNCWPRLLAFFCFVFIASWVGI